MGYYNVNDCNGIVCDGKNTKNLLGKENNEETQSAVQLFRNKFQQCWKMDNNECWEQENGEPWYK
jgi:hypothetical protein